MQYRTYTHKGVEFQWHGRLNIFRKQDLMPMKMQLNNGVISWRLNRTTWLSIKQLKNIINGL